MRILFRCDEYPPMPYGGIGSVTKLVAEALAAKGHYVVVAGVYQNPKQFYQEINRVHVYSISDRQLRKTLLCRIASLWTRLSGRKDFFLKLVEKAEHRFLSNIICKHKIELIEYVDYQDGLFHHKNIELPYHRYAIPSVVRIHGSASFMMDQKGLNVPNPMIENDRANIVRADAICAVSQYSAEWVKSFFHIERPINVIYNPIDSSCFHPHETYPQPTNLLFFGKIVRNKGIYSLLEAFTLVHKTHPEVTLTVIGAGDPICQEGVVVKPFMPHDKILEEIDQAYLTILPSYFENFSMAALEVLARNGALVFTERASGKELIEDGVNGWLVDPDNVSQIAEVIIYALEHPEVTRSVANRGYQTCIERYSTNVIVPRLEHYYSSVIQKTDHAYS